MGSDNSKTLGRFDVSRKVLGRGAFGTVYKGTDKRTGETVAVKDSSILKDLGGMGMEEIKNLQLVSTHKHIVKLLDSFFRNNSFKMVVEYCDVGDLDKYMRKYRPRLDKQLQLMSHCSSAVSYLHGLSPKIVHRDLKPGNLLVKTVQGKHVLKVADFGISKVIDEDPSKTLAMKTLVGTPAYISPEMLAQEVYNETVDVFAMGVMFLGMIKFRLCDDRIIPFCEDELIAGRSKSIGQVLHEAHMRNIPFPEVVKASKFDDEAMVKVKELIRQMVNHSPADRPSAERVHQITTGILQSDFGVDLPDNDISCDELSDYEEDEEEEEDKDDDGEKGTLHDLQKIAHDYKKYLKAMTEDSDDGDCGTSDGDEEQFRRGDRVQVTWDEEQAKEEQKGHGDWVSHMTKYLGCYGYIQRVRDSCVTVMFDNAKSFKYSPLLLRKVPLSEEEEETWISKLPFRRYDVVVIKPELTTSQFMQIQKNSGSWKESMLQCRGLRGIVSQYKGTNCYVEFMTTDSQFLSPACLDLLQIPGDPVYPGDKVCIIPDRRRAKALQFKHGEWITAMEKHLGHTGIVKDLVRHDQARVDSKGKTYMWNLDCLKVLARGDEMKKCKERK